MSKVQVGKKVRDFKALLDNEETFKLSENKGKNLVFYFYPKDNTPGCTAESCDLNANYSHLLDKGFEVLGVSPDSQISHLKFIDKYNLAFNLIADTERRLCNDYGVWGKKKFMGKEYMGVHRTTFIINNNQKIDHIFTKVNTKDHTNQILEIYK